MKVIPISKVIFPKIINNDLEIMKYEIGGFISIAIVSDLEESDKKILKTTISVPILALKVMDDFNYMNWGKEYISEYPNLDTLDREIFVNNIVMEFIETKYLMDFNKTSSNMYVEKARHFCVHTRNEIIDFISEIEPIIRFDYIDKQEYENEKQLTVPSIEEFELMKKELAELRDFKQKYESSFQF
ncbi:MULTISPECIES: hypothetical protein [unclassified Enterococcus]|uniref:hypothetical protein n=1 Tax=unclassified Enterococcus TaxID=2608891 RepID=UPI00155264FC|nr:MULTISPECIES: hypothetical protein [unclassified Enterococcus]MBS7577975.1 hypothetical protein [Enterococcus sp. MMGLQ5-2]MBS7585164.1 hypothetical protein [Enterococcus sp. MMGLQ5-1]NPD13021.1 hypothetical protein [Enterococcus sp. MMGLQ5-1]NPD37805.1 hypothetical protein [Enterococcus sp. MMGLQ5-2]